MNIIFHHPRPLDARSTSASEIRPVKMLEAFQQLGCQVDVVAGYSKERRIAARKVRAKIKEGQKYEFLYSESSTLPTLLTNANRLPIDPSIDFGLFRFCRQNNIPIGLFYRDIYWAFDKFKNRHNPLKYRLAKFFYEYDLHCYEKLVDKVYLPSPEMEKYVPILSKNKFDTLPPGHSERGSIKTCPISNGIRLLYVGGIGVHYQMYELFSAMREVPGVTLTICTRQAEWALVRDSYQLKSLPNVEIVHLSGDELSELYLNSDIALIYVEPHEYWEFAVPFKLFEYVGKNKPVVASAGTFAGKFVEENNLGWSIPYSATEFSKFLRGIENDLSALDLKKIELEKMAPNHTWQIRCLKVINDFRILKQ